MWQTLAAVLSLFAWATALAEERPLRVAILDNVPPLSYLGSDGKPAGFAVELANALCDAMKVRCTLHTVSLAEAIDALAADRYDFASINLLATPERREKVLFSKSFYHSVSIWLAKPAVQPGAPGVTIAAVRGSAQSRYIETQGWKSLPANTHLDVLKALTSGTANAALVPMLTSVILTSDPKIQALGLQSTLMSDPLLSGDVRLSINPQQPELKERIDAAIDTVKRDGRFDRINTKFLPFRLQ
jgi:ABC-type amino acid transport substrate-binding protein